jgi:hypothetical protein
MYLIASSVSLWHAKKDCCCLALAEGGPDGGISRYALTAEPVGDPRQPPLSYRDYHLQARVSKRLIRTIASDAAPYTLVLQQRDVTGVAA